MNRVRICCAAGALSALTVGAPFLMSSWSLVSRSLSLTAGVPGTVLPLQPVTPGLCLITTLAPSATTSYWQMSVLYASASDTALSLPPLTVVLARILCWASVVRSATVILSCSGPAGEEIWKPKMFCGDPRKTVTRPLCSPM